MATVKTIQNGMRKKRETMLSCLIKYNLAENTAITDEVIAYKGFPNKVSKKLAFLILTYKREATTEELKKISDQPAAMVRSLRNDGFLFQDNDRNPSVYFYVNSSGQTCRRITGFRSPKVRFGRKVAAILGKSVAACISAIEIYNKPDFKYREETFSILLVNAWELLLKARVLFLNDNKPRSIQEIGNDGRPISNRSGNAKTIDIHKAINVLVTQKELDERCRQNLRLLVEIRDNAVHYVNKSFQFSKRVQEIGTAALKNYVVAIGEWFQLDLSQYNFYLMPMSFFHPFEANSFSITSHDKEIQRLLNYFSKVENSVIGQYKIRINGHEKSSTCNWQSR
jgi:hypothetical protein